MSKWFAPRRSVPQVEEGSELAPKFDANGLIPAVVTDHASGELLMHAFMNREALRLTIESGEAHYYSRSRGNSGARERPAPEATGARVADRR